MATRVLLAINERLFRESLRAAVTRDLNLDIVGEAGDGREALTRVRELSPDLVILQPCLKELNGAETIHQIRLEKPALPVVAVSRYSDYPLVMRVLKAGASAFILTDGGLDELKRAVQATVEGRTYLIEYTDDLANPAWQPLPNVNGDGQVQVVENTAPGVPQRYFRFRTL